MTNKKIKMPDIGAEKVEVIEIFVKIGDKIKKDQSIITVEGDKTSIEIPSTEEGIVQEIICKIGDKISTGATIIKIQLLKNTKNIITKESKDLLNKQIIDEKISSSVKNIQNDIHASPLIRRLSRKLGVNLLNVKGTGNYERILKEDLYCYIKKSLKKLDDNSVTSQENNFNKLEKVKNIELSKIQKISGDNLTKSWTNVPHVTLHDQVDITDLENFRKQKNEEFKNKQINKNLTILLFIIKSVSQALIKFPNFNSSIAKNGKELILRNYINIGIAVDTIYGLFVVTIYNTNKKSISDISNELTQLSNKARKNKLHHKDIEGSCFTISSLGNIGCKFFNPIINFPEVAILGISKSSICPIWNGKKFIPRLILPLSLSFDHRVINGAEGSRFMNYIINIIHDIRNLVI